MDRRCNSFLRILHSVKFGRGNVLALGAVAVILAALVTLAACVDEPTVAPPPTPTIAPTLPQLLLYLLHQYPHQTRFPFRNPLRSRP